MHPRDLKIVNLMFLLFAFGAGFIPGLELVKRYAEENFQRADVLMKESHEYLLARDLAKAKQHDEELEQILARLNVVRVIVFSAVAMLFVMVIVVARLIWLVTEPAEGWRDWALRGFSILLPFWLMLAPFSDNRGLRDAIASMAALLICIAQQEAIIRIADEADCPRMSQYFKYSTFIAILTGLTIVLLPDVFAKFGLNLPVNPFIRWAPRVGWSAYAIVSAIMLYTLRVRILAIGIE